jgi:excisionase family DNA binding protein
MHEKKALHALDIARGPLLDIDDAAKALGISTVTLYKWARQRRLRSIRIGSRVLRFALEDLEAFIRANTSEARGR